MQARQHREYFPFPPLETKPLPDWLSVAPPPKPEKATKWAWIVLGVALLFGSVIGGGYWVRQRGQIPVPRVAASSPAASHVSTETPTAPPMPQLVVGLPGLSSPTTGAVATQSPGTPPSQSPQLAVGLRPIADQPPTDTPAPAPVAEAPPPDEPLPSPSPPPKPHRKANPQLDANPSQSSGFVKF
jgi:hypothetical protein